MYLTILNQFLPSTSPDITTSEISDQPSSEQYPQLKHTLMTHPRKVFWLTRNLQILTVSFVFFLKY